MRVRLYLPLLGLLLALSPVEAVQVGIANQRHATAGCTATLVQPADSAWITFPATFSWSLAGAPCDGLVLLLTTDPAFPYFVFLWAFGSPYVLDEPLMGLVRNAMNDQTSTQWYWAIGVNGPDGIALISPGRSVRIPLPAPTPTPTPQGPPKIEVQPLSLAFNCNAVLQTASMLPLAALESPGSARIDPEALRALASPATAPSAVTLPDPSGALTAFSITPFEFLTPDARLIATDGKVERPLARPAIVWYRGTAQADPACSLSLAVVNGTDLWALVRRGGSLPYAVLPAPRKGSAKNHVLVTPAAGDVFWPCGTDQLAENQAYLRRFQDTIANLPRPAGNTPLQLDLLLDIGRDFVAAKMGGDADAAVLYALNLIGAAAGIYHADLQVSLAVKQLVVWTAADPFAAPTSFAQLQAYQAYNQTHRQGIARDAAFLFAGQTPRGGAAYLAALCNNLWGYGIGNFWGEVSFPPVGYHIDLDQLAHELGHLCGSVHTHCYVPPIDKCYSGEPGCYAGPVVPQLGTIMSYCHLDLGIDLVFHPRVRETIRAYLESIPACVKPAGGDAGRLVIRNTGRDTLTVTSLALAAPAPFISWLPPAPFSIAPGREQALELHVACDAVAHGGHANRLLISSNDAQNNPLAGGVQIAVQRVVTPSPTPRGPCAVPTVAGDADNDLVPDAAEFNPDQGSPPAGTNRYLWDSDGDGLADGYEDANRNGVRDSGELSPRARDSDGDGAWDGVEVLLVAGDPLNPASPGGLTDSDADGLPGVVDPNSSQPDSDGDRFTDGLEAVYRGLAAVTNPSARPPLGDINCDNAVSNIDALIAQSVALGLTPRRQFAGDVNGDVNRDGFSSNLDALIINSFFLNLTPRLPTPAL